MVLLLFATGAKAATVRVDHATDYWFQFTEQTSVTFRTHAVNGFWSDPHLWLYNSDGILIAANDDWYGLQSRISADVQPGWYRLRAGVCCGNPDAWWSSVQYDLETSASPLEPTTSAPTTSSSTTTTTLPEPTTTTTVQPASTETSITMPDTVPVSTTTMQESVPQTTASVTTTQESLPQTTSSTVETWLETTTTTEPPTTTLSSTTSSSTTTIQPDPTTTTSTTTTAPSTTLTVESTTTTVLPSSSLTPTSLKISQPSSSLSTSPTTSMVSLRPTATVPTSQSASVSTAAPTTTSLPIEPTTPDEAIAVLTQVSSPEEAAAAIQEIAGNIDTLTSEQLDNIAKVVSQAPKEVKHAFEAQVNIFGGGLDNYVPADSNVNVAQRRTLVAVGAALTALPLVTSRKR